MLDFDVTCLLKETKLIIWDEATVTNMHCFEARDRSLRNVMHRLATPYLVV